MSHKKNPANPDGPRPRYVRLSRLPAGEDRRREYKGHRCLSHEEIPQRLKHSRRAVSRNINGFLNTGKGGKIFLGVLDDGTVAGLRLSDAQKDHVSIALFDLMRRYTPPVPQSRYRLSFVLVWREDEEAGREGDSGVGLDTSEEEITSSTGSPSRSNSEKDLRLRGHLVRTAKFCWCDWATRNMILRGDPVPYYVVEITILPFVPNPALSPMALQLHPVYQSETGHCYFRGSTSLLRYSYQEFAELTVTEVEKHFDKIKEQLRAEVKLHMTTLTYALAKLALQESCDSHMA